MRPILYGWELTQQPFASGDEVWVLRNGNLRNGSGQECSSHKKNLPCAVRVPGGVNCGGNVCKFPSVQDFYYTGEKMKKCVMCPRNCGVDRENNETGYCGESSEIRVAKTSLHQWEEPCITGRKGSGTVFFTGCNMKCIFCQNHVIAENTVGKTVSKEELAELFLRLQDHGAANINLVTAAHFIDAVAESIKIAKNHGLILPVVYNSSAYEKVEMLRKLDGLVDIYLPDLKFMDPEISEKYAKAADYFVVAEKAIKEMVRQVGKPLFSEKMSGDSEEPVMQKGVIVRHLVLPGHTKEAEKILRYLYETYHNDIFISIMNQFTPVVHQKVYQNLNRCLTRREYQKVIQYALDLGIENAYIQEGNVASESFIPIFDGSFI